MMSLAGIHGSSGDAVAKRVAAGSGSLAPRPDQPLNGEKMV